MAFVTVTTTTTRVVPVMRFDKSYIKTIPGMLKAAEAVVCLLGYICIHTVSYTPYRSAGGWYYSFVAMTGFWVSLNLLIYYLFHIIERYHFVPWLIIETGYAAIWTAFCLTVASVAAANGAKDPGLAAAAFFGYLLMVIYGYEAVIKYKKWKGGESPQGETPVENAAQGTPAAPPSS